MKKGGKKKKEKSHPFHFFERKREEKTKGISTAFAMTIQQQIVNLNNFKKNQKKKKINLCCSHFLYSFNWVICNLLFNSLLNMFLIFCVVLLFFWLCCGGRIFDNMSKFLLFGFVLGCWLLSFFLSLNLP